MQKRSEMPRHRILIVDDSPTMRQLLGFALKRLPGAETAQATDGMDALRKLTAQRFDLALVDINMPVMDGLKLVSLVRGEPSLMHLRIVVVTTEGSNVDREAALACGADEYLTKPIQGSRVVAVVKQLLEIP